MTFLGQLLILAIVLVLALVPLRLIRMRLGRTPFPDGLARWLSVLGLVVAPPLILHAITPRDVTGDFVSVIWVPIFATMLGAVTFAMTLLAIVLERVVPARRRRTMLLALVGNEGDPYRAVADPPMTPSLLERMRAVARANAVFPRGHAFPEAVHASGFSSAWAALDVATTSLEQEMASESAHGVGIAAAVRATATDARSRLDTLRWLQQE